MGLIRNWLSCFLARQKHFGKYQKHDRKLFSLIFHNIFPCSVLAAFSFFSFFYGLQVKEVFIENLFFRNKKINKNVSVHAFVKEPGKVPLCKKETRNVSFGLEKELLMSCYKRRILHLTPKILHKSL